MDPTGLVRIYRPYPAIVVFDLSYSFGVYPNLNIFFIKNQNQCWLPRPPPPLPPPIPRTPPYPPLYPPPPQHPNPYGPRPPPTSFKMIIFYFSVFYVLLSYFPIHIYLQSTCHALKMILLPFAAL